MRIESIHLRDVGPFDDQTINFPPGSDATKADTYLLVGPNGSGKSTVLYAIAAAVRGGFAGLGGEFSSARMRSARSHVIVRADGELAGMAWCRTSAGEQDRLETAAREPLLLMQIVGNVGYFRSSSYARMFHYAQQANAFSGTTSAAGLPPYSWAAFAYAGMRSVVDVHVKAIEDLPSGPFANSLSFVQTADTGLLAKWIALQDFRRLKAKELGRHDRAAELEESVRRIERVVSEIIDEEFRFVLSVDDNDVRASRNGRVVDLGLLPDGLKSIVSWVADLLMRMDRIPWENDIPPMERSFLLLLDEVDIHLHPAWQRKVLPIVQRVFPHAQIIASTHSPFVVASAEDAHVITLAVKDGVARVEGVRTDQIGVSYSSVLRGIFGIDSEFDVETERRFAELHAAKGRLLRGDASARAEVDRIAGELATRSEEVRELVALELRQMDRQLSARSTP